jgi:hypothetical protein
MVQLYRKLKGVVQRKKKNIRKFLFFNKHKKVLKKTFNFHFSFSFLLHWIFSFILSFSQVYTE